MRHLERPIVAVVNRWGTWPAPLQVAAWPLVFLLSLLSVLLALPGIAYRYATFKPTPVTLFPQADLIDWAERLVKRFDAMIKINPPECLDVLQPAREDANRLLTALNEHGSDPDKIKLIATDIAESYAAGKGEPIGQLYGLALHVSHWAGQQNIG